MTGSSQGLLRARDGSEPTKVTFVELFFDLVFVFAVTQLSHGLLDHLTILGAVETALLSMAIWWVWIYTSWVTNWLDPAHTPVRLMLFALMLAGLMVSMSIPEAFGSRGIIFAAAYVFMQVGRSLFMLWAVRPHSPNHFRNFRRIAAWLGFSGVFWIAGGFADDLTRFALWAVALFIEYLSPGVGFWVPGWGRSKTEDWDVEGRHMAERCGLFIIIALGESILVTGVTFGTVEWTLTTLTAFAIAFIGSVTMWWLYFNVGAERGSHKIAVSSDPGRLARLAYTYIHVLLVAGIIVAAVGDELVLAHPTGDMSAKTVAVLLGGPALYLLGNLLFKRCMAPRLPRSHMVGLGLLVVLIPASFALSPLGLSAATTAVLIIVAVWETMSVRTSPRPRSKNWQGHSSAGP